MNPDGVLSYSVLAESRKNTAWDDDYFFYFASFLSSLLATAAGSDRNLPRGKKHFESGNSFGF